MCEWWISMINHSTNQFHRPSKFLSKAEWIANEIIYTKCLILLFILNKFLTWMHYNVNIMAPEYIAYARTLAEVQTSWSLEYKRMTSEARHPDSHTLDTTNPETSNILLPKPHSKLWIKDPRGYTILSSIISCTRLFYCVASVYKFEMPLTRISIEHQQS